MEYKGIDVSKKSSIDSAILILEFMNYEFYKSKKELDKKVNDILNVFIKNNIPFDYKDILYKSISINITKNNKSVFDKIKSLSLNHCSKMIDFHSEKDKTKHFLLKNKSAWIEIQTEIKNIISL